MKERQPILPVLIGPPGVGKTTLAEIIHGFGNGVRVLDGDSFISDLGVQRLQNGTWDDTDRVTYLANMARGAVSEVSQSNKIILIDAMTTRWMRHYFVNKVEAISDVAVKWVQVTRQFHPQEVEDLIRERAMAGHPINSIQVFERFSKQFEPLDPPFETLVNPGIQAPRSEFQRRILTLVDRLYGDKD